MAFSPSLQTVGIAVLVLVVAVYFLHRAALPKPLPGIPYNPRSAQRIFGDVSDLAAWKTKHGDPYSYLPKLANDLNSPIFQVFLRPFGKPWVVLMDPRESHDIMTRRFKDFDRSAFFGEIFKAALPAFHVHMPTGDAGSEWHAHRRLMSDTMSPSFLNNVAGPEMHKTMRSLIELWKVKARLAKGRPFLADMDIHKGALDIIWSATFGEEIGSNKGQGAHLAELSKFTVPSNMDEAVVFPEVKDPLAFTSIFTVTKSMDIPISSPFPRWHHWFALKFYPELRAARKHKDQMILSKLQAAKERFALSTPDSEKLAGQGFRSALDLVVAKELKMAEKENRQPNYTSQAIQDELFGFLIAGHETTSVTVCWALKYLTSHQECQEKLRTSLQAAFPEAAKEGQVPSIADITKTALPYLDAVAEESGRLGLTAIAKARITLNETELLGYHIPKGIDVRSEETMRATHLLITIEQVFMMNNGPGFVTKSLSINEDKRSKTSQAAMDKTPDWDNSGINEFRPQRWLVDDENGNVSFDANAGPNLPFGAGPRACFGKSARCSSEKLDWLTLAPGRKWAQLELRIILVLIFWSFELQPTPAELSNHRAIDGITHRPETTYVRLKALN